MDVGATLREARQRRGMSLEDLERLTKIRKAFLDAIEANRRDPFPHAIYARGFVSAYAREVGLDPDDITKRFFEQFEPSVDLVESEPAANPRETLVPTHGVIEQSDRSAAGRSWQVMAFVLVAGLLSYSVARWTPWAPHRVSPTPPATPSAAVQVPTATDPPPGRPAETGTSGAAVSNVAAGGHTLHLEIRADGSCWLSATTDGTRVVNQLMQSGEQHALDVQQEAVLRVGDPAAFAFSINGIAGRPLGRPGEAVTVHITSDNYREFLRH